MTSMAAQSDTGRRLLQLGVILFLVGLFIGFAVPALANPRMGLASHLEALMNGIFLMVLGLTWPKLRLPPTLLRVTFWLAVAGAYANMLATLLAAMWAAGGMMPIAGQGSTGTSAQEMVITALLISLAIAMVLVCFFVIVGLRGPDTREQP